MAACWTAEPIRGLILINQAAVADHAALDLQHHSLRQRCQQGAATQQRIGEIGAQGRTGKVLSGTRKSRTWMLCARCSATVVFQRAFRAAGG